MSSAYPVRRAFRPGLASLLTLAVVDLLSVAALVLRHHEPGLVPSTDEVAVGHLLPWLGVGAALQWADVMILAVNLVVVVGVVCIAAVLLPAGPARQEWAGLFGGGPVALSAQAVTAAAARIQQRPRTAAAPPRANRVRAGSDRLPPELDEFLSEADTAPRVPSRSAAQDPLSAQLAAEQGKSIRRA